MANAKHRKLHDDITAVLTAEGVPDDGLTLADITARLRLAGHSVDSVAISSALFEMQCLETAKPGLWLGGGAGSCVRYWRASTPTLEVVKR